MGVGCHPAERFLGSLLVVFAPPSFDHGTRLQQVREPVLVEAFVAEATVEPLKFTLTGAPQASAGCARPC